MKYTIVLLSLSCLLFLIRQPVVRIGPLLGGSRSAKLLSCLSTPITMDGMRTAQVSRKTNETDISVDLNLDATPGSGIAQVINVSTGIGFLDHVLRPLI